MWSDCLSATAESSATATAAAKSSAATEATATAAESASASEATAIAAESALVVVVRRALCGLLVLVTVVVIFERRTALTEAIA